MNNFRITTLLKLINRQTQRAVYRSIPLLTEPTSTSGTLTSSRFSN